MTFTWKPSTKCLECSDLQPATNFPDMKLLTRYNLPLSEQTASCPRVCFFPPCNERQASHYVRSCNARLTSFFQCLQKFYLLQCCQVLVLQLSLYLLNAISNKTDGCGMSCIHLFSKATNTTRSLLQVFSKLLLQVSLCYLQVNRRHKLSQISSWRSCTHQTGSHWISLLLDTRPAFSDSSSALNRLTLSSAWTKWKRNLLQWFVQRLPGHSAS